MSRTTSAGVFGAKYWVFMAKVMARRLDGAVKKKRVEAEDFPAGVYADSRLFFRLVSGAFENSSPINRPASINAYVVASRVVNDYIQHLTGGRKELDTLLSEYASFLESISNSRPMDILECQKAEDLSNFFKGLAHLGVSERYQAAVRLDGLPRSLGLAKFFHS
jgi:hypothetical protein